MSLQKHLREQCRAAHEYLDGTTTGLTDEQVQAIPPGKANPLGASYAHLVVSEDLIVNVVLKGAAPLMATEFSGRTGLSEPMPMPGPEWARYGQWARTVQIDFPTLKAYGAAVFARTDEYLASLSEDELQRAVDLAALGWSPRSVGWVIGRLVIGHADNLCGECSALKGILGLTGYPT
jgi:hypothetical protein